MRISLRKRIPGEIEFGIIYGGIALLGLVAARFFPVHHFIPSCVFKGLTGIPCPTCGATRSVMHLSFGDLSGAVLMNPLAFFAIILAVLSFIYGLVTLSSRRRRVRVYLSAGEKNALRAGIISLILANWVYLIRAGV